MVASEADKQRYLVFIVNEIKFPSSNTVEVMQGEVVLLKHPILNWKEKYSCGMQDMLSTGPK